MPSALSDRYLKTTASSLSQSSLAMLKRPRPHSPLLLTSNFPMTGSLDVILPTAKRRRLLPDSSDHTSQPTRPGYDCDDDEEDFDELEQDVSNSATVDSPYKDTNSFLYELHTLHRHRQLFSQQLLHEAQPSQRMAHLLQYTRGDNEFPSQSVAAASPLGPTVYPSGSFKLPLETSGSNVLFEVEAVKARYEETNRLLGSLFLSRRQELTDDDKERPHR
ncbi:hypothetical protein E1B28_001300 [Marasmius oreades]|uniref:Uncharacterized protein n=1 Tax=Marasmius oreades TaxID=181124 RepID=A0A9P8AFA2_9AGAR|nr:uncharacterized protein E1B28_001300 [Marasmius oreades]KAG7099449.1 hypothetical protein E1B28_001300 [Marasmius oreades]